MSHAWVRYVTRSRRKWNDYICKKCKTRKIIGTREVYYRLPGEIIESDFSGLEPDCNLIITERVMLS